MYIVTLKDKMFRPCCAAVAAYATLVSAAPDQNIIQVVESIFDLSTLVQAVSAGGLVKALEGTGPFTLFAPVNEAFQTLGPNVLDYILNPHNNQTLKEVLLYHVLGREVESKDIRNNGILKTLDYGETILANVGGGVISLNEQAEIVIADLLATNGVVHTIDEVLVSDQFELPSADIAMSIFSYEDLTTLATAVQAGNLSSALSAPNGPWTLLTPTNVAFDRLPANVLKYLLAHPKELDNVLEYHLFSNRTYGSQIVQGLVKQTVQGQDVTFQVNKTGTFVNSHAQINTIGLLDCENGVMLPIDEILVPKAKLVALKRAADAWASG